MWGGYGKRSWTKPCRCSTDTEPCSPFEMPVARRLPWHWLRVSRGPWVRLSGCICDMEQLVLGMCTLGLAQHFPTVFTQINSCSEVGGQS